MLEQLFKLSERHSSVKQELFAGLTTFLTMLYIIPVNGLILSASGMPMHAVMIATICITIIATFTAGVWANVPVAMSVGMGLNAYFTYGVVLGMKVPWQSALGIIFVSGVLFLVLTLTPFRKWILDSIPHTLRSSITTAIGFFLSVIALMQMGIITHDDATLVTLGNIDDTTVLIGIIGIFITLALFALNVPGGFVLSILLTSLIAWSLDEKTLDVTVFTSSLDFSSIFLELDIAGALQLSLLPVILIYMVTDLFDSVGSIASVAKRAGLEHDERAMQRTLEVDAAASVGSGLLGVSSTTAFIESLSGVEAGGRTGLTSVFTALFFILPLFILPLFQSIPSNAIYPVLFVVGALMFSELQFIDFGNITDSITAFVTTLMMVLSYSITDGIAAGVICYIFLSLFTKPSNLYNAGIWILGIISIGVYLLKA